jgi:hypothetical protein
MPFIRPRLSLFQYLSAKHVGEGIRREDFDVQAQQLLQFKADGADVEQRRLGRGLHQQIQVTAFNVLAQRR